ncbi:MAG: phosphoglucosamine mutase [Oscillospiraceae bacterium]|nr:phosphoglucosamine mutase [Oscillospiraceae bacterium]
MSNFTTNGLYGLYPTQLGCESTLNYARALCLFIAKKTDRKPVILVGTDTRLSSQALSASLCAGICSAGGDCINLGVVPSPAVSYLIPKHKADAGVMLCASGAGAEFNGIRLFSSSGFYFSQKELDEISEISKNAAKLCEDIPVCRLGKCFTDSKALWDYNRHVISQIDTNLKGVKVAVDCANGSASLTAKNIFEGLGASCTIINDCPDGNNINKGCGINDTEALKRFVIDNHYALGIAFDGDAGRIAAVDENGALVDTDRLLTVFAKYLFENGMLKNNAIICTMMTNLGVSNFCRKHRIEAISTKADEHCVAEKMLKNKYSLGADHCGHIFFESDVPVSDAQLCGVKLIELLIKSSKKLSELALEMERCSQVLMKIKINPRCKEVWKNDVELTNYISKCSQELGDTSRIIVRESPDEAAIRVLVEGRDFDLINKYAMMISDKIKQRVKPK